MSWNNPQLSDLVGYKRKVEKLANELGKIKRPDRVVAIMYQIRNNAQRYITTQYKLWEKEEEEDGVEE